MPTKSYKNIKIKRKKKHPFLIKVIAAVIGSALCGTILLETPIWGTVILISFASGMTGFEMSAATGLVKSRFLQIISVSMSAAVPWMIYFGVDETVRIVILFVFIITVFMYSVFFRTETELIEILTGIFAAFVFPLILSLFIVIIKGKNGRILVLLPLIIAWMCDAFSQIIGMKLGKHKLIERISPNKTIEGFFGGIVGSLIGVTIYAVILHLSGVSVHLLVLLLTGFVGALLSAVGDLSLSFIKRKCGIKDYGCLIPEHGGVLDRFDSVIFVLPLCVVTGRFIIG